MPFPLISQTDTDIWIDFWNGVWKTYIESLGSGGSGGWPSELTSNGRIVLDATDAGKAQLTGSPSLGIVIPDGAQYVVAGVLQTADGDQAIVGLTPNVTRWLEITVDEDGVWDAVEHETRPALGTGIAAKVMTGAGSVTNLDTSEAETDVILAMPLLLTRLNGGSPSEGDDAAFWDLLKRSNIDPTTIAQFVIAEIEARIGAGQGATIIPPEVRDETMVNVLHSLALHQISVNDAFERVAPYHAIVVSPGRGTGDWAYDELTDVDLTTMPVDTADHIFGQVP